MTFRKRPLEVEAVQYTGENREEVRHFAAKQTELINGKLILFPYDSAVEAKPGDWVIKDVNGQAYPCKPDVFAATYDPVPARS